MKCRVQYYVDRQWKLLAVFESNQEAIRLLPAIGRLLGVSVRLLSYGAFMPDVGCEPIPRGVFADNGANAWTFRPEPR